MSNRHCFKCQGLEQISSEFLNRRIITLAEWHAIRDENHEEEQKEDEEEEKEDEQEEVVKDANEGETPVLCRVLRNQHRVKDE